MKALSQTLRSSDSDAETGCSLKETQLSPTFTCRSEETLEGYGEKKKDLVGFCLKHAYPSEFVTMARVPNSDTEKKTWVSRTESS